MSILWMSSGLQAQPAPAWNAAQIKLQLEKLRTVGSVLYVAAHPDDENTRLLAYLANGKKYRTAYLSLTRGDGGQNLIGDEQGEYLGLIRTQELLAARRIDGAEQFFSRANDFGFSKSADEAFTIWGHDRVLADAVWVIRKFRPDVIICRFPEDSRAGHGHHWASAIIGHEAFLAAGDPTKFPEQLRYVKPWKAKRILWNTFNFGGNNTTSSDQFRIDVGGYNPLLGKGYGEIASASRSMHKSQGFGASLSYGHSWEYFRTIAGEAPRSSLMDGVNTSWSRVEGGAAVDAGVAAALKSYDMDNPAAIVPQLLKIRKAITATADSAWKAVKLNEVDRLIAACAGLRLNAVVGTPYVAAGASLEVRAEAINRSTVPVTWRSVTICGKDYTLGDPLPDNDMQRKNYQLTLPDSLPISQPYWLLAEHPQGYYQIPAQQWVGLPENPPSLEAVFHLTIDGEPLEVTRPLTYVHVDPVRGELHDPLVVAPAVTANVENEVYVFTGTDTQQVRVKLKAFREGLSGTVHLTAPAHFRVQDNDQAFTLSRKGDEALLTFALAPSAAVTGSSNQRLQVEVHAAGATWSRGLSIIAHDAIPTITVFPPAAARLVSVPLKTSGHRLGYIMGAGDKVPEALRQVGYSVTLLSDEDLAKGDLQAFDAIIAGVRAYNVRDRLQYVQPRLMAYVRQGGTYVVQYNKNGALVADPGPYPFRVTRDRVTEEDAAVKVLLPDDPVMTTPNKITPEDFDGWIQERGLYFVDGADAKYRKPLSMHDKGEAPLDGSLIVAQYGKGKYVYTALDFFRELPAGIPGAFRLFANLIAR